MEDNKIEIRAPTKIWRIRKQLINSIQIYKDWMYLAGATVEGSSIKVPVLHPTERFCFHHFYSI